MSDQKNTAIVDGVRAFYDQTAHKAVVELPDTDWPTFDELDGAQARAWMLAYAATIEAAVRMGEALLSLEIPGAA